METIYPPERFKATENVDLAKYFKEFSNIMSGDLFAALSSTEDCSGESDLEFMKIQTVIGTDITSKKYKTLEKECSIDLLLCEGEIKKRPFQIPEKYSLRSMILNKLPFSGQNSDLQVLKQKTKIEEVRSCEKLLFMNKENFHYCVLEKDKNIQADLMPGSDFVMNIYLYKPFSYSFLTKNYPEKFRFSQEIQMLGKNTLTELRDIINCISDTGLQAEVDSPTSDISHLQKAKEKYPSASFFIDGVFYNDMRSPRAIDYSEEIIKWAENRKVGTFTSADMQTETFVFNLPSVKCGGPARQEIRNISRMDQIMAMKLGIV